MICFSLFEVLQRPARNKWFDGGFPYLRAVNFCPVHSGNSHHRRRRSRFFCSHHLCGEANPACRVTIFERGKAVLEKVRVSGGGRCNVTHACFDARELVKHYPRGSRELLGPFLQFGPEQTVEWFACWGVALKTEADGRMFPVSDDSRTITECLQEAARRAGVQVCTGVRVEKAEPAPSGGWRLRLTGAEESQVFSKIMITTGSNPAVWDLLKSLGHTIVSPVPSLFTFNTKDTRLCHPVGRIGLPYCPANTRHPVSPEGPLLITHWDPAAPPFCVYRPGAPVNYTHSITGSRWRLILPAPLRSNNLPTNCNS